MALLRWGSRQKNGHFFENFENFGIFFFENAFKMPPKCPQIAPFSQNCPLNLGMLFPALGTLFPFLEILFQRSEYSSIIFFNLKPCF